MTHEVILMYTQFIINFFVLFTILINILLLIASVFKTKNYSLELVLLGMISFCVFMGIHEFLELTIASYRLAHTQAPYDGTIISDMFALMGSMLILGVAITKKRLQKIKL